MFSAKSHTLAGITGAAALSIFGVLPGYSATEDGIILAQQQAEPSQESQAPSEETAPAATPESSGSEEGAGDTAAPDHAASPAPEAETPSDAGAAPAPAEDHEKAASPENGSTEVAPVAPESAAPEETHPSAAEPSNAQSSSIDASQLKIGAAVFGSDGTKIGEINGVKTDTDGKVQEILVTDGVPAGINAKVFAISGDKITDTSDGVKLSLTSEEAKQLPVIDNSDG